MLSSRVLFLDWSLAPSVSSVLSSSPSSCLLLSFTLAAKSSASMTCRFLARPSLPCGLAKRDRGSSTGDSMEDELVLMEKQKETEIWIL